MNLLILCPDQLRADYLSCYGHPTINTQHIDRLAAEGVRFAKAYCSAPLCGPSRISFVTSTRFSEHNHRNYGSTINFAVPNLVRTLKEAGYRTAMFGKNHCFNYEQLSQIWNELREICLGNYDNHPSYKRSFDAFPLEPEHPYNITGLLADEAITFIGNQSGDKPWLCWVNWQDPHPAFTCPEPYYSMFDRKTIEIPPRYREGGGRNKPKRLRNWQANSLASHATDDEIRNAIATYMGQVKYIDDSVGRILATLEETGQDKNTLVVFFADHGELLGDQGAFHKIGVFYECLTRIPLIIRHPQGKYRGAFYGLVEEVDLAPTILEALGLPIPLTFVGESLHQKLVNGMMEKEHGRPTALVEAGLQAPTWPTPVGFNQKAPFAPNNFGPGAMITDGRYKVSVYYDDICELYDLSEDPKELDNRFEDPTLEDIKNRLTLELCKRLLGIGVRDIGRIDWPEPETDPRDRPLEVAYLRRQSWKAK
ncbi:MAG: sulfatase family protein [Armatimonadota bacterium]